MPPNDRTLPADRARGAQHTIDSTSTPRIVASRYDTTRRRRTVVLVKMGSAEDLAISVASASGGRVRAIELLQDAIDFLWAEV